MITWLENIDRDLFLFLNGLNTPTFDFLMWYISTIILWVPLFAFFFYYAYKKGQWPFLVIVITGIAFCILLADRISVEAFKEVFMRYRPTHNLEIKDMVHTVIKPNGERYLGGQYGFLSSHAANFFAIATFTFNCFRQYNRKWSLLFLWAALIGYSRIYLGVHYPSDVIAGALLGIIIGYFVYFISKSIQKKYGILTD